MKKLIVTLSAVIAVLNCTDLFAQDRKDKAEFKLKSNDFYEQIQKGIEAFEAPKKLDKPLVLRMDFTGIDVPKSLSEFKTVFAQQPVSQGETGTCWCFSTTSFYESEIKRISKKDIQLSELFTVYWQYVQKTKEFVRTRGVSVFDEGSETNGVVNMMKKYGIVP